MGYSNYPFTNSPEGKYETRARHFNFCFKNGRGCMPKQPTFADVVNLIVKQASQCPAFAAPSVLVPIPRSGSSRASFAADACPWPNKQLAEAFAGTRNVVAQLLERAMPLSRSSDGATRVPVDEHVGSLHVRIDRALRSARIVLIDDNLTKGTQSIACLVALRRAGYIGPVEAFFVSQTIAPNPAPEQREPFLRHYITWMEGQRLARRVERGQWRHTVDHT
jgi:hypothetical protein